MKVLQFIGEYPLIAFFSVVVIAKIITDVVNFIKRKIK